MSNQFGVLFIVSTPIGNLGDLSARAISTLQFVDLIAAEDTRRTGQLLSTHGIRKQLISLHDHNEAQRIDEIVGRLGKDESIALVSDAGTPLISDPGYRLVVAAIDRGIQVTPVPGPCAAIAALSVSGLPTDSFFFAGFLPHKSGMKKAKLAALEGLTTSLVFYVSVHRLQEDLESAVEVLGQERRACLARELTKKFETIYYGSLGELAEQSAQSAEMHKGELVLVVAGAPEPDDEQPTIEVGLDKLLGELLPRMSLRDAVDVVVRLSGERRNKVYSLAQALKKALGPRL